MTEMDIRFWNALPLYKGFLPVKDALRAQQYVVLIQGPDEIRECAADDAPQHRSPSEAGLSGQKSQYSNGVNDSFADDDIPHPTRSFCERPRDRGPNSSSGSATQESSFYMFLKSDVTPPPLKYTISPKQVTHTFYFCERSDCNCECLHVRPGCWRLRLDTLPRHDIRVSSVGHNRRLRPADVRATAGYFFSLGLLHEGAIGAAVPVLCRFNERCRHGCSCLFVHANVQARPAAEGTAGFRLRQFAAQALLDAGGSGSGSDESDQSTNDFFTFLEKEGMNTIGDLQSLGVAAYEALVATIPTEWAELFLTVSTVRNLERKQDLRSALLTFPRVPNDLQLPDGLRRVGDLLDLPSSDFYQLALPPHVLNACDLIRTRYAPDEEYSVITLAKEPPTSFFSIATRLILDFGTRHAHCSWRKNDPTRPLVTSIFTYVDVANCRCRVVDAACSGDATPFSPNRPTPAEVLCEYAELPPQQSVGVPANSWCKCPRRWEIGVNYELSTPSGSRCSEQNVMGKLASLGVPTWAVRELFVHGHNVKKEPNPLFPCGVCDNMLQKVNKDVAQHFNGDIVLYMFDATKPRKIVFLPVPEISHRDGSSFKYFVSRDLRPSS